MHQVSESQKQKKDPLKDTCPDCGHGVRGVDSLCDDHWSEFLGTHAGGRGAWEEEGQKGRVLQHCVERGYAVTHIFEEVGSGMNDNRPKLHKLFDLAVAGEITRVVVEHKDRFIRFNAAILTRFLNSHGVQVEWMQDVLPKSYEAEIVEDMMSLIASFSAKVYGRRSADRRRKAAA
jgi:DNA invertase Pin-like site-specific DNA recombinase